jgi:hypothetical protein
MEIIADELTWRKSSASGTGNCVEIAFPSRNSVLVRNSKRTDGPVIEFNRAEWESFLTGVKHGEFDLFDWPRSPGRSTVSPSRSHHQLE